MSEIDQTIARLESELALPNGFFDSLKNEDDWSFILKCHALMESACSFLLTAYFNDPSFEDIFSRLEMSDKKKGKVAFLQAAALVIPEEATFIIVLSELRNKLIHNIRGVTFSFSEHVSSLDKNQRRNFANGFGYAFLNFDENGKPDADDFKLVLTDPKSAIFAGVKVIMAIIKLQVETKEFRRESGEQQKRIYELMKQLNSTVQGTHDVASVMHC